jgi:hypothetical protein
VKDRPPFLDQSFNAFQMQTDEQLRLFGDTTKIIKMLWIIIRVLIYIANK